MTIVSEVIEEFWKEKFTARLVENGYSLEQADSAYNALDTSSINFSLDDADAAADEHN